MVLVSFGHSRIWNCCVLSFDFRNLLEYFHVDPVENRNDTAMQVRQRYEWPSNILDCLYNPSNR